MDVCPTISMQFGPSYDLFTCLAHASTDYKRIAYTNENPFYRLLHKQQVFETPIVNDESKWTMSFGDRDPKVYTHLLVIPKESKFVQFWDLIEEGNDEQLEEFFREIHRTAEKAKEFKSIQSAVTGKTERDLVKHGYRMVINNYGTQKKTNHADQWVPHLHAHIGGGECLAPVALRGSVTPLCSEDPQRKEVWRKSFSIGRLAVKVYHVKADSYPAEFIFESDNFASIHDFAEGATAPQIKELGNQIIEIAKKEGFIKDGFRIYSNHGFDAHRGKEELFRLHVAYGVPLNDTLGPCIDKDGRTEHKHCEQKTEKRKA